MPTTDQLIQAAAQHLSRGQGDQALALLRSAVGQDPGHPVANQYLGVVLAQRGQFPEAIAALQTAVRGMPNNPGLLCNLGMLQSGQGDHEAAAESFQAAIRLKPDYADAHACLGIMRANQQRASEAEASFKAALRSAPARGDVVYAYTRMLTETGRADEAVSIIRAAQRQNPGDLLLQDKLCMMLNYVAGTGPEELRREHARFGELAPRPDGDFSDVDRDPGRRLRIGYVSPDLREHSVAYFLEPILEKHDRAGFEIFAYHVGLPDETTTPRLRARCDHWRSLFPSTDDALLQKIADDRIDIVVELAGHTSGNRLAALARRAAPVQVTYIGYPNSTGLPAFDARIVDAITDPPGTDSLATERLVRLDGCFLCYRPPEIAPEPAPPPAAATGHVTFGSFNSLAKLSPPTIDLWARILNAVPDSRLVLKGKALSDPSVGGRFVERFAVHGVSPERIDLLGHTGTTREHLEQYGRVDIALDPFPYNGTTTTCEALWMGVPVIALHGDRHASRVGMSLLRAVGLDELIAASAPDYLRLATGLAADPGRRAVLRRDLRSRLAASPLCDASAFVPRLEQAYRGLWRDWCAAPPGD